MSGLSEQQLAAIRAQLGDAQPASDGLIVSFGKAIADRREHEHPRWEDLFCMNLSAYMGERAAPVLRRLLDAEAEREVAQSRIKELERHLAQSGDHGAQAFQRAALNGEETIRLRQRVRELEQQLAAAQAEREVFLAEFENDEPRLFLTLDAAKDALTERRRHDDPLLPWDWFPDGEGLWVQWRCDPDTDRPVALLLGSVLPLVFPAGLLGGAS